MTSEPAPVSEELGKARIGRWRVSTAALRAYTMVFALIAIWLYFQWMTRSELYPYGLFLHPVNLANLLKQMSVTGVLAVGMLLVIVARQIDLSVGSVVGLAGGVAAISQGWGLIPSLAAAIVIGIVTGALHGLLAAYANIPAFIVTLGGLLTWRGVILYLTKGETIPVRLPVFRLLGVALMTPASGWALAAVAIAYVVWSTLRRTRARRRYGLEAASGVLTAARILVPSLLIIVFVFMMNRQGGVPLPVIILIVVAAAGAFLTRNTTFGRYLYAIGSNPDAARLS
ncbi:MAG: ABC transporter permease subunit, partial [Thermoanaerobaculia bacterium]